MSNKKGFTLVEILIAILIVTLSSAALAVSVSSASEINETGIIRDENYSSDLVSAQSQAEGTGREGSVSIDGRDQDVNFYGDGELATAGGDSISSPAPSDFPVPTAIPTAAPTPPPTPEPTPTPIPIVTEDPYQEPDINSGFIHTTDGLMEYHLLGMLYQASRDFHEGDVVKYYTYEYVWHGLRRERVYTTYYCVITKDLTLKRIDDDMSQVVLRVVQPEDVYDYAGTSKGSLYVTVIPAANINDEMYTINDDYKRGSDTFPKYTLIKYNGKYYMSTQTITQSPNTEPGSYNGWLLIDSKAVTEN